MAETELNVTDNRDRSRYEAVVDGHTSVIEYDLEPEGVIVLTHTEVPIELSGRGIGSQLVRAALDDIRARSMRVVPQCAYVSAWIRKHPDYAELVAKRAV